MTRILRAAVDRGPISLTEHEHLVAHDAAGAVVGFSGVVRNHDGGREVVRLEYSAHPHGRADLFEVLAEVAGRGHRGAGDRGQPSRRARCRSGTPPWWPPSRQTTGGGVRDLRPARRRHQGAATGVEAPVLRRRHRRVGELGLKAVLSRWPAASGRSRIDRRERTAGAAGPDPSEPVPVGPGRRADRRGERTLRQRQQQVVRSISWFCSACHSSLRYDTFGLCCGPTGSSVVPGGGLSGLGRCWTPSGSGGHRRGGDHGGAVGGRRGAGSAGAGAGVVGGTGGTAGSAGASGSAGRTAGLDDDGLVVRRRGSLRGRCLQSGIDHGLGGRRRRPARRRR